MSDSYTPDVGQHIDADGRVSYDFDGHIHARGLDLDAGVTGTPPADRRVRWLDAAGSGGVVAEILSYKLGSDQQSEWHALRPAFPFFPTGFTLLAGAAGGIFMTADTNGGRLFGPNGESLFVEQRAGDSLMIDGPYSIDSGPIDPGNAANAFLNHNLNAFVFPLAAPTDNFFGYDITWVYANPSPNTTRFAFRNIGPDNAARVVLAVFLLTIT